MTRPPRNPPRAYDHDGHEIPPMALRNRRLGKGSGGLEYFQNATFLTQPTGDTRLADFA